MPGGNTIGRVLGQSPPSECEAEGANPLQKVMEKLQTMKELADHIKELVETFKPEEAPEPGEAQSSPGGEEDGENDDEEDEDPVEALIRQLTQLGERLGPSERSMEGAPRGDQAATRGITDRLVALIARLSGEPGSPVDRSAMETAFAEAEAIVREAPSEAQGRQALDNALTKTRMAGMSKPATNVLEKVKKAYEAIKGIVESAKKLIGEEKQGDGAWVMENE